MYSWMLPLAGVGGSGGKRVASRKKGDARLPEAGGYQAQAGRPEEKRSHRLEMEPVDDRNTPLGSHFETVHSVI
ncbi:hypothetical protein [Alkalicoccus chagannorensis]|uniref:hypothetical protein n=1 Tax=Alkalicoccus chagannorensis TaxID=427072 RepID=UPI0005544DC2|nr:hypothetical protein [Alkalicoccus chagannorensis]